MSALIEPPTVDKSTVANRRRLMRARRLVAKYRTHFPSVSFEIVWSSRVINAQALNQKHQSKVLIYGGLIRHPSIGYEALSLTICHEIGHLRRGGRRMQDIGHFRCECFADLWALRTGLPTVYGRRSAAKLIANAAQQFRLLIDSIRKSNNFGDVPLQTTVCTLESIDRLLLFQAAGATVRECVPVACKR